MQLKFRIRGVPRRLAAAGFCACIPCWKTIDRSLQRR